MGLPGTRYVCLYLSEEHRLNFISLTSRPLRYVSVGSQKGIRRRRGAIDDFLRPLAVKIAFIDALFPTLPFTSMKGRGNNWIRFCWSHPEGISLRKSHKSSRAWSIAG